MDDKLQEINDKLDSILKHQEWEKKQWEESKSFSRTLKNWISFYFASLLADETLGRNGNGNNKFTL